ncbi:MAG: IS21 family transposase, partial [Nitrospirota bacterium]
LRMKIEGEPMLTASRLFREINGLGYAGSSRLVRLYVGEIRVKKEKEATVRFETLPGQQAQVDFDFYKRVKFTDYEEAKSVSRFNMVLGYCRMLYYGYYFRHDLESFIDGHISAFEYLGGVPHEILYDNVKCVVIQRYDDNGIRWNSQFLDFARYYGFKPLVCQPYRAQTKGKVERPHQYAERDFFMGQEFKNLADLNNRSNNWMNEVANKRIHGTTNEIPVIRLEQEREYLLALPSKRYEYYQELSRRSSKDCYISYQGNRYSVPYKYANNKELSIKVSHSQEKIFIYAGGDLIASHNLCFCKGQMITNPEHIKGIVPKQNSIELQRIYGEFSYLGEAYRRYLSGLKQNKVEHLSWQVKKILELVYTYGQDEVNAAIERALKYEAYGYSYIRNICQELSKSRRGGDFVSIKEILTDMLKQYGIPEVETRSLKIYDQISE